MGPSPQLLFPASSFPPAGSNLPRAPFGGVFSWATESAAESVAKSWGYASVADAKRQLARYEWGVRNDTATLAYKLGVPGAQAWLVELAKERADLANKQALEVVGEQDDEARKQRNKWLAGGAVAAIGLYAMTRGRTRRNPSSRTLLDRAGGTAAFGLGSVLTLGSLFGILFPEPLSSAAGLATIGVGLTLMASGYESMTGGKLDVGGVLKNPGKRRKSRRSRRRRA